MRTLSDVMGIFNSFYLETGSTVITYPILADRTWVSCFILMHCSFLMQGQVTLLVEVCLAINILSYPAFIITNWFVLSDQFQVGSMLDIKVLSQPKTNCPGAIFMVMWYLDFAANAVVF